MNGSVIACGMRRECDPAMNVCPRRLLLRKRFFVATRRPRARCNPTAPGSRVRHESLRYEGAQPARSRAAEKLLQFRFRILSEL